MNQTHKEILENLSEYLKYNPGMRFTQALFNLGITEFVHQIDPRLTPLAGYGDFKDNYEMKDIEVLTKIKNKLQ